MQDQHARIVLTRNGRPAAVLISPDDLEALEETLELLSNSQAVRDIEQSRQEIAGGDYVCHRPAPPPRSCRRLPDLGGVVAAYAIRPYLALNWRRFVLHHIPDLIIVLVPMLRGAPGPLSVRQLRLLRLAQVAKLAVKGLARTRDILLHRGATGSC